jgi:hypothetical protein
MPAHGHVNEGLGELPRGYGDGRLIALVRDPSTLFLYWDFSSQQIEGAFDGLGAGHARLKLWSVHAGGNELLRESEIHLDARGHYARDLPPGHEVRAEIWAVGDKGARMLRASRPVKLPPASESDDFELFWLRLRLDQPLRDLKARRGGVASPRGQRAAAFFGSSAGPFGSSGKRDVK